MDDAAFGYQVGAATAAPIDDGGEMAATAVSSYKLDEFLGLHLPPREMLLKPWLPQGGSGMAYGPRGLGKTHVALGVGYAVASGGTFLNWQAPAPKRVLYIDGEMPAGEMQSRLEAIAASSPYRLPDPSYFRIVSDALEPDGLPDLSDRRSQLRYEEAIKDADLIIVDNLSTLCRGLRENEADTWTPMQEWVLAQRRAGRSVLLVHHAGKGGNQRGTSRKEDILDTVIALRRPPGGNAANGAHFEVHFEKSRGFYGKDAEPFQARLVGGEWQISDISSPADEEAVMKLSASGLSVRAIAERTGLSKSKVQRIVKGDGD